MLSFKHHISYVFIFIVLQPYNIFKLKSKCFLSLILEEVNNLFNLKSKWYTSVEEEKKLLVNCLRKQPNIYNFNFLLIN